MSASCSRPLLFNARVRPATLDGNGRERAPRSPADVGRRPCAAVSGKVPQSEPAADERLPRDIEGVPLDVVETGPIEPL